MQAVFPWRQGTPCGDIIASVLSFHNLNGYYQLSTQRWETAILLIVVTVVELFGGYAFTIALSRRIVEVNPPLSA